MVTMADGVFGFLDLRLFGTLASQLFVVMRTPVNPPRCSLGSAATQSWKLWEWINESEKVASLVTEQQISKKV